MILVTPSCSPCIYSLRLTNAFTFPLQIIALLLEPGVPALLISSEPEILEDARGNAWEKRRYLGRVTLGYMVSFLAWAFLIVAVCMLFRGVLKGCWLNMYGNHTQRVDITFCQPVIASFLAKQWTQWCIENDSRRWYAPQILVLIPFALSCIFMYVKLIHGIFSDWIQQVSKTSNDSSWPRLQSASASLALLPIDNRLYVHWSTY
jgi:hypothetical protein